MSGPRLDSLLDPARVRVNPHETATAFMRFSQLFLRKVPKAALAR